MAAATAVHADYPQMVAQATVLRYYRQHRSVGMTPLQAMMTIHDTAAHSIAFDATQGWTPLDGAIARYRASGVYLDAIVRRSYRRGVWATGKITYMPAYLNRDPTQRELDHAAAVKFWRGL